MNAIIRHRAANWSNLLLKGKLLPSESLSGALYRRYVHGGVQITATTACERTRDNDECTHSWLQQIHPAGIEAQAEKTQRDGQARLVSVSGPTIHLAIYELPRSHTFASHLRPNQLRPSIKAQEEQRPRPYAMLKARICELQSSTRGKHMLQK